LVQQGKQSMLESETHAQYKELDDDVRLALLEEHYKHAHKDMIDRVLYVPHGDKWATTSRDGSIRFWQGKDLSYIRTLRCGKAWVTDLGHMPRQVRQVAPLASSWFSLRDFEAGALGELWANLCESGLCSLGKGPEGTQSPMARWLTLA
jgi:WD40 repeat protein